MRHMIRLAVLILTTVVMAACSSADPRIDTSTKSGGREPVGVQSARLSTNYYDVQSGWNIPTIPNEVDTGLPSNQWICAPTYISGIFQNYPNDYIWADTPGGAWRVRAGSAAGDRTLAEFTCWPWSNWDPQPIQFLSNPMLAGGIIYSNNQPIGCNYTSTGIGGGGFGLIAGLDGDSRINGGFSDFYGVRSADPNQWDLLACNFQQSAAGVIWTPNNPGICGSTCTHGFATVRSCPVGGSTPRCTITGMNSSNAACGFSTVGGGFVATQADAVYLADSGGDTVVVASTGGSNAPPYPGATGICVSYATF